MRITNAVGDDSAIARVVSGRSPKPAMLEMILQGGEDEVPTGGADRALPTPQQRATGLVHTHLLDGPGRREHFPARPDQGGANHRTRRSSSTRKELNPNVPEWTSTDRVEESRSPDASG